MRVRLSLSEMQIAAQAAVQRQLQNLKNNAEPAFGAGNKNDWQLHIEGCLGEMALAKSLGVYWDGKGIMRSFDVGSYDVRTTSGENSRLIIHDSDPDDRFIFLLVGSNGSYRICGGIIAKDAKQQKYWVDPGTGRPAYFIPQKDLRMPNE